MAEKIRQSDIDIAEIKTGILYIKENFQKLENKIDTHLNLADSKNIHTMQGKEISKIKTKISNAELKIAGMVCVSMILVKYIGDWLKSKVGF